MKCEKAGCANIPQHRPNDAHHERAIMVSDCILFKPLHRNNRNAEAHRIAELEEARGQLLRIFEAEGHTVAAFEWGAISLPLEMREKLTALVGHKIAVLRLGGYHVREVVASA